MESSDLQRQQYHQCFQDLPQRQFQHHPEPQINNTGLTRLRSAPSSYFATLMDPTSTATTNTNTDDFLQPRPLSPETETIFARFIQSVSGVSDEMDCDPPSHGLCDIPENSAMGQAEFMGTSKQETDHSQLHRSGTSNGYGLPTSNTSSQMIYQTLPSSNKPPQVGGRGGGDLDSLGLFSPAQMQTGSGVGCGNISNSTLIRHRSSPAGLFDNIRIENGYIVSRGTGGRVVGGGNRANSSTESTPFSSGGGRFNGQINLPPPPSSYGGMLTKGLSDDTKRFNTNTSDNNYNYLAGFPNGSWDDSSLFSNQLSGLERGGGELNPSENQSGEGRSRPAGLLAHHLSLPKTCLEKLSSFHEPSVPCEIRAKRGCATHPRSIAERVRRTRISERMRKLQDLVPSMDKQTNTADMLDLAVEYIKGLQNQVKMLTGKRARCTCSV